MRELLLRVGSGLGKRDTKRRKDTFLSYFGNKLLSLTYEVTIKEGKERKPSRHLFVGNVRRAKAIFVCAYETERVALNPFYKWYPVNQKANLKEQMVNIGVQTIGGIVAVLLDIFLINQLSIVTSNLVVRVLANILMALLIYFIISGLSCPVNYNHNTAAVVLQYSLAEQRKKSKNFACVFADATTSTTAGYSYVAQALNERAKKRPVIVLDSLGSGDQLCLFYRRGMKEYADLLASHADKLNLRLVELSDEEADNSPLAVFPRSMLLASGIQRGGESPANFVAQSVRTWSDTVVDIERLENIRLMLNSFLDELDKPKTRS